MKKPAIILSHGQALQDVITALREGSDDLSRKYRLYKKVCSDLGLAADSLYDIHVKYL